MGYIAISTVFKNTNYGAVLQAYALSHKLHMLTGKKVYFIDYIREQNTNLMHNGIIYYGKYGKKSVNLISIKKACKALSNYDGTVNRTKTFMDFITENMNVYEPAFYAGDTIHLEGIDVVFLGSDQIWNPTLLKGFHDSYFGIVDPPAKKVIAYAPSLGKITFSESEKSILVEKLRHVDVLSCREEIGCTFLRELTGRTVHCVLDPTFLLTKKEWTDLSEKKCILPDRYVLVYTLRFDKQLIQMACSKARAINGKVLLLGTGSGKLDADMKDVYYPRSFGPKQFLSAVINASYIITDSFHGTAFSIIMQKDFLVKAREEKGQRMEHICRLLHLEDRVFRSPEDITSIDQPINYEKVILLLNQNQKESVNYIVNALKD